MSSPGSEGTDKGRDGDRAKRDGFRSGLDNTGHGLRPSGMDFVGELPWGSHLCMLFQTKQDLLDIMVPYFKAGLENNELCIWVPMESVDVEEAKAAMAGVVPCFEDHLKMGRMEIIPSSEWYLRDGYFDKDRVTRGWMSKMDAALASGFDGLRLAGNTLWVERPSWNDYEVSVSRTIGQHKMLALCPFYLETCNATDITDIISTHQFALLKREGRWSRVDNFTYHVAKDALVASEERYRSIVDTAQEGVFVEGPEGTCVFANQKMAELLKYPIEEILGKPILDFVDTEERELFSQVIDDLSKTRTVQGELQLRRKDGTHFWSSYTGSQLFDGQGSFMKNLVLHADTTRRKEAEDLLTRTNEELEKRTADVFEERQRLYSVLEGLPALVCLLTPDYHIVFSNRAFRERFGESQGRPCYEQCFGLAEPCGFCESYRVLESGKPHQWEVRTCDGVVLEVHDFPFTDVDGSPMVLEMNFDVTERKRTEEELRRAKEELEARVQERTVELRDAYEKMRYYARRMTDAQEEEKASISRELHDEVGQILSYAVLQVDRVRKLPQERVGEAIDEVKSTITDTIHIVRDLCQALRPPMLEAGLLPALSELIPKFKDRSRIDINFGYDDIPRLDPEMNLVIYRVVQEALTNVMRHAQASAIDVSLKENDGHVVLVVGDNGVGFDDTTHFRTAGLSGMKERVLSMNGELRIESQPGAGTCITARFPHGTRQCP